MRFYKVNGITHTVYDSVEEAPPELKYLEDWRDGRTTDWVKTDDECIIQILRSGTMMRPKGKERTATYVGTCTGTFPVRDSVRMDTSKRENIYSFSGLREPINRGMTRKEKMFVYYLTQEKLSPEKAYLKAFPTNNSMYANDKAASLIKKESVLTAVKEELKPVLDDLGITNESVLKGINDAARLSEKEDVKLRALFKLADILDLEDKQKTTVTQLTGVAFGGFDDKMLEVAERPKEITNGTDK